ncbi:MAG: glycine zipper 2TM domain-containing protein [Burkholderiales bacterium]|nr:glycine zipper 2TM domain-containing protein [Burkholderiales bacterium]
MTARLLGALLALAAVLGLGACAAGPQANITGNGTVVAIHEVQQASTGGQVVGALGGALLGGWLGSNIGGGTGQTIATTVGAVGGAAAGSAVASNVAKTTVWDVTVRFEDGIDRTVRTEQAPAFRPGDRVRVSGSVIQKI